MAAHATLQDVYNEEIKDLWSANDQMTKIVKVMSGKAHDPKLKQALEKSLEGIKSHTDVMKTLLAEGDETVKSEHCKGMEGLVKEATKHVTQDAPKNAALLDIVIISQYQRMSHYGLAGFGTAAAYAKALGMQDHVKKLNTIVKDIYSGDEYVSKLAEKTEAAAAHDKAA